MKNVEHSVNELAAHVQAEHQATLKIVRRKPQKRKPDASILIEAMQRKRKEQ